MSICHVTLLFICHRLSPSLHAEWVCVDPPSECAYGVCFEVGLCAGGGAGSAFYDGTGIGGRPQKGAPLNCPVGSMPVTGAE